MYVKVASNLYAEPETLLQCHYCSSSLSVIMEEQHLSFLHVFQINLDKVQYASLQENLQHCEFKPHNPCTQGEVSKRKPTKFSQWFIFFP